MKEKYNIIHNENPKVYINENSHLYSSVRGMDLLHIRASFSHYSVDDNDEALSREIDL